MSALRTKLEALLVTVREHASAEGATAEERARWSAVAETVDQALATRAPESDGAIEAMFAKVSSMYTERLYAKILKSWVLVDRAEAQARLHTVMALARELDVIRKTSTFATRLADSLIEDVITGDWPEVQRQADGFRFVEESENILWAKFVEIAETEALLGIHRARALERGEEPRPN